MGRGNAGAMPRKTALARELWRSVARSRGRFVSIMALMALGSFALVGLFVAGPDMRAAARGYFDDLRLADVTVISDYGLDGDDVAAIDGVTGASDVEYGYFADVTIDGGTTSVRVMSTPGELSQFELVGGRMPERLGEVALDSALSDDYAIGDVVRVSEKGDATLACDELEVVGLVNSCEVISTVNMGQSTAGTGSLGGYAVVPTETFDSDVFTVARIAYDDVEGVDPYGDEYRDRVQAHKDELEGLLADRPEGRLATVRSEAQDAIDEGQAEVDDARARLADAETALDAAASQITEAERQIEDARGELATRRASGQAELDASRLRLDAAASELAAARSRLDEAASQIVDGRAQVDDARAQLSEGEGAYAAAEAQLAASRAELETGQAAYEEKAALLEEGKREYDARWPEVSAAWEGDSALWERLDAGRDELAESLRQCEEALAADPDDEELQSRLEGLRQTSASLAALDELKAGYEALAAFGESYEGSVAALESTRAKLDAGWSALAAGEAELADRRALLDASASALAVREAELAGAQASYDAGEASYGESAAAYAEGLAAYEAGEAELASGCADAEAQIADAEAELAGRRAEYRGALDEFESGRADAEAGIADAEADLADARERVAGLTLPVYDVDSRREAPWSDAYGTYATVAEIIDSLARVFPVFLYLVAALVTLTTMTRMVDEDRINSGTFKALGYSDMDVARKFMVYGAIAGGIGAVVGIALGHTLLPWIVYMAYGHAFTLPPISLEFHPGVALAALVLAGLCSVLPAWVAVRRELRALPARLLLPKPPASGSKILLERVTPLWERLSFTRKVTARNLFRYKQRMLMTVLGVAGAVSILVTGFGVQASIQQMATRQFGAIIRYDMIVADKPGATASEAAEVEALLEDDAVASHAAVRYESASLVAGDEGDRQDITLLVPEDVSSFAGYVGLVERSSERAIELSTSGAVISERLADLLGVGVGDVVEFEDGEGAPRSVTVSGVCEMYMGHFMFLSPEAYEGAFGRDLETNASLVRLEDPSTAGVEDAAARFMGLAGVKGVVQNITLQSQVDTIVSSLDKIMTILIAVAAMLGVVIMYNLTNLNVSERLRELSTIKVLGFHSNETTMYIYRETILLTTLGVLVGYVVGVALHEYVLWVVPPDNVMFDPDLSAIEFVVPAAVTAAITLALYFVVLRRLRRIDMLEALKSVE